jgi:hypothetical protein
MSDADPVVLINVYRCAAEKQPLLMEHLAIMVAAQRGPRASSRRPCTGA